ncbi:hypothetical protein I6I86_03180 [Moraxella osloensis]|nr:hypothetical protein [Moraxella osloensis]MBL7666949.1 hypothetical protein [Moraxella osloensis]
MTKAHSSKMGFVFLLRQHPRLALAKANNLPQNDKKLLPKILDEADHRPTSQHLIILFADQTDTAV